MMNTGNRIRLLAAVFVALSIVRIAIGGDSDIEVAYHVTSPDKKVEIRIPEEAIPLDVDVLSIAMERIPGGYALKPDGLKLTGTVTISMGVGMTNDTVQIPKFTLHTDDKSYRPVDIRVRRHYDLQTAVIEVDTENFRQIELQ